ncbi:hypothetical protein [Methylobacterium soli]|uniref:Head-tail adaptor protein n=1 Tax=Methylobacterium soli TaxID=553447 RepID=A0A6L3SZE3_9HYPH|nr:hypothetical protein [Methylobacterium soli]KAB1079424.1 hypothetical protein F6X53_11515 [Methylobacterium soli]GJE45361.1 hypothetical protein AEGHOMDF_4555 [Methylobacterium soli]
MAIDLDATVLAACQDAWGVAAMVTPRRSAPGEPAFAVRGIYALKGADYADTDGNVTRMDNYTFSVRVSELPIQVQRGDKVSNIALPFLKGLVFTIEDTGDDGFGAQAWVLKAENIRTQGTGP